MLRSIPIWKFASQLTCWMTFWVIGLPRSDAGYVITDLGIIATGQSSRGSGINSSGGTSGTVMGGMNSSAVQATPDGSFESINVRGLTGVTTSSAAAINNDGQVAGTYVDGRDNTTHAFIATNRGATELGRSSDPRLRGSSSQGVAINSSGLVLGNAQLRDGSRVVFRATAAEGFATIALPGGSLSGSAGGINSAGTVVGSFIDQVGLSRVFVAQGTTATEVALASHGQGFGGNATGVAINDTGAIAGYGDFGAGSHAFFVSGQGTFVDIGVRDGFTSSFASGMNNLGQVVGSLSSGGAGSRAFFWDQQAGLLDLNRLLIGPEHTSWTLASATGVNDSGQIVGTGFFQGQLRGFLLTPVGRSTELLPSVAVPTPPSAWLAAGELGIVGGWFRLKRGRKRARDTASRAAASQEG